MIDFESFVKKIIRLKIHLNIIGHMNAEIMQIMLESEEVKELKEALFLNATTVIWCTMVQKE